MIPEETVADNLAVWQRYNLIFVLLRLIVGDFTLILQVELFPSAEAVMIVSPGLMAVTVPFSSTVAILFLLLFQVTFEL